MDSIPKFLASIIIIIIGILFCFSFVISSVVVNSARTYHASVIEEIENSNYDEITVKKSLSNADSDNYSLTIEQVPTTGTDPRNMYKVTLGYALKAPIFGKVHSGTVVGYAMAGRHMVEPTIEIPENPQTGDVFFYNDYEYRYNMYFVNTGTWYDRETQNGWGARVLDDSKTEYNRPLSMIGDTPVVSLDATYYNCKNLLKAPEIPDTVVYMQRTYQNCISMSDDVTIPNSVESLLSAFDGCTSETFVEAPDIPDSVSDMTHTFTDCINLEKAPVIPLSVKYLSSTFYGCESLTDVSEFEAGDGELREMNSTFVGCTSLPEDLSDFEIPSTVKAGYKMFMDCTQLESAPVIHENLTDIRSIFENCTSLTGRVFVHSDPAEEYCEKAFAGTIKPIVIDGECSEKTKEYLIGTATNGNLTIPDLGV